MSEVLSLTGEHAQVLEAGQEVGRFRLGEVLGRGGMATVYRAYDTAAERDVAVKVLYEHLRSHPFVVERFKQEVQLAQGLEHPHIVRTYQLLETPQMLGLVMDVHGTGNMKEYVQRHGPMHANQVVMIADQVLRALSMAHERGLVHRDIKPHNILWDPVEKVAKLIDFGLAALDEAVALARPESAMGTVEYSAPEQFDDFGVDARADLYSLGVTLFELLSGSLPYRSETAAGVIQMHRTAPVADVRVFVRGVPGHVADALSRAMAKLPEERFASADEMRRALLGEWLPARITSRSAEVWEKLKARYRGEIETYNWHVYLPAWVTQAFIVQDARTQNLQGQRIVEIFRKHQANYRGDYLAKRARQAIRSERMEMVPQFHQAQKAKGGELLMQKSAAQGVATYYDVFAKQGNQDPTEGRDEQLGKVIVPFACGLTQVEAEKMCRELEEVGILARSFQGALRQRKKKQRRVSRHESLAFRRMLSSGLALVGVALLFLLSMCGGAFMSEGGYTVFMATYSMLAVAAVGVLGAQAGYSRLGPDVGQVTAVERLHYSDDYLLQFRAEEQNEAAEYLVDEEHAALYYRVRSSRVRGMYEQFVLQMLRTGKRSEVEPEYYLLLEHVTRLVARIAELEARLTNHNQAALFEQLARLDAQLAQAADMDRSEAVIEQKIALTEQLRRIDEERREMVSLTHELSVVVEEQRQATDSGTSGKK